MIYMLIVGFFTTYAASEHIKQKIADAANDSEILEHNLSLHEAAEMIFTKLFDVLKP